MQLSGELVVANIQSLQSERQLFERQRTRQQIVRDFKRQQLRRELVPRNGVQLIITRPEMTKREKCSKIAARAFQLVSGEVQLDHPERNIFKVDLTSDAVIGKSHDLQLHWKEESIHRPRQRITGKVHVVQRFGQHAQARGVHRSVAVTEIQQSKRRG